MPGPRTPWTLASWAPAARRIGVLALQGGFAAHVTALRALGRDAVEVRDASGLARLDALVLPGGESTAQLRQIERGELLPALQGFVRSGRPVLATCAGLILAARRVENPVQPSFGWLDVVVARNAWGRQLDSFTGVADDGLTPVVAIRAPRIIARGPAVTVLATLGSEPILVQQGAITGATFHPELGTVFSC